MGNPVDEVFERAIAQGDVPGAVAMVANDSEILYEGAFGTSDLNGQRRMAMDSLFRLASMTKAVTSAAALQLVEQGRIALDQPVATILPEFERLQVLVGFYGDHPALRPATRPATIRHLLTHTSGLGYEYWNAATHRYQTVTQTPGIQSGRRAAFTTPLVCDPGSAWCYGYSTDWLGFVVEAVSGESLDVYLRDHLLGPLGMSDTGFDVPAQARSRFTSVITRNAQGRLEDVDIDWTKDREYLNGGHGLYSTARDYIRFLRMFLGGGALDGTRVLRTETVADMCRNHIGDLFVTTMLATMPEYSNDAEFFPGMKKKHGLGFIITCEQWPGMRAIGSCGWAGILNSYYWFDPTHKLAAVLMLQVLPFTDHPSMALYRAFEQAVYAKYVR